MLTTTATTTKTSFNMADFSARRYLNPSLGEFDVNLMMEKASAISMNELKDSKARSGGNSASFVVDMPAIGADERGVQMFRQRAQIDTGGMIFR